MKGQSQDVTRKKRSHLSFIIPWYICDFGWWQSNPQLDNPCTMTNLMKSASLQIPKSSYWVYGNIQVYQNIPPTLKGWSVAWCWRQMKEKIHHLSEVQADPQNLSRGLRGSAIRPWNAEKNLQSQSGLWPGIATERGEGRAQGGHDCQGGWARKAQDI